MRSIIRVWSAYVSYSSSDVNSGLWRGLIPWDKKKKERDEEEEEGEGRGRGRRRGTRKKKKERDEEEGR